MRPAAITLLLASCAALNGLAPIPASAGDPGGSNSTIPGMIRLVGHDGNGQADPAGLFTITIRNLANDPVPGANVIVDFNPCPDAQIGVVQQPGVSVFCTTGASAFTDAAGRVQLSIIGRARPGPAANLKAKIYADGVLLGSVPVAMFDLDGDGVHGADLALWTSDFVSNTNPMRSDYDGNGFVAGADLSLWLAVYLGAKSIAGANTMGGSCP